jgi:hypothetical protein
MGRLAEGLKPSRIHGFIGTTEVVPFHKAFQSFFRSLSGAASFVGFYVAFRTDGI